MGLRQYWQQSAPGKLLTAPIILAVGGIVFIVYNVLFPAYDGNPVVNGGIVESGLASVPELDSVRSLFPSQCVARAVKLPITTAHMA